MRKLLLFGALAVAACDSKNRQPDETSARMAVAVRGESFDIAKIVVPGQVTIVEFWASW